MNNERFEIQNSLDATYLNIQLEEPVELDEIAVQVMKSDCPEFLIPFRIISMNNSVALKYKLMNTVSLQYMSSSINKKDFVQLYLSLLTPFLKGKDWFLDYHYICIDPRYIYVDNHGTTAHFIYIPEYSCENTDAEIVSFFDKVFQKFRIRDDSEFSLNLYRYFGQGQVTLTGLYQLFQEELGRPASGTNSVRENRGGYSDEGSGGWRDRKRDRIVSNSTNDGWGESGAGRGAVNGEVKESGSVPDSRTSVPPAQEPPKDGGKGGTKVGFLDRLVPGREKKPNAKDSELPGFLGGDTRADDGWGNETDNDGVIEDLFGNGKDGKKKKKEKEKEREKTTEKKEGLGLFGKKKEKTAPEQNNGQNNGKNNPDPGKMTPPQRQASAKDANGKFKNKADRATREAPSDDSIFQSYEDTDETEIDSDYPANRNSAHLELIDSVIPGAMRRIDLNFTGEYVTIGRKSSDQEQPDIVFPGEFKRIGRQHARIDRIDGKLYIIDLGSQNHTLLNGQILAPNQPYLLQNGAELTFADSKPVRYRVCL